MVKFKKGDKVTKILSGFGVHEKESRVVHSVEDDVVYLVSNSSDDREEGITYNLDGFERERFFDGMLARIEKV